MLKISKLGSNLALHLANKLKFWKITRMMKKLFSIGKWYFTRKDTFATFLWEYYIRSKRVNIFLKNRNLVGTIEYLVTILHFFQGPIESACSQQEHWYGCKLTFQSKKKLAKKDWKQNPIMVWSLANSTAKNCFQIKCFR